MILLDASLLSLAYRRKKPTGDEPPPVAALRQMIHGHLSLGVPGIVLQQVLSGVQSEGQFEQLQAHLASFALLVASQTDHAEAARIARRCAARNIACSPAEALVAAQTVVAKASLFTLEPAYGPIARQAGFGLFDYRKLLTH